MSLASTSRQRARLDLNLKDTSSDTRRLHISSEDGKTGHEDERHRRRRKVAKRLPLKIAQDSNLLDGQRAARKIFFEAQHIESRIFVQELIGQQGSSSSASAPVDGSLPKVEEERADSEFRLTDCSQQNFLGREFRMWIAERSEPTQTLNDKLAIRIRTGSAGYSEWMNELQVYLLPNFRHIHILPQFRPQTRRIPDSDGQTKDLVGEVHDDSSHGVGAARVEYWLVNSFHQCVLLRDFLRLSTLSWSQLIYISLGILRGLHFLHENIDYQNFNQKRMMENFIRSTDGAIKKLSFTEGRTEIHMKPSVKLSVIHRNLSSLSVVLRGPQLIPCIWNFGLAYIQHPFQPVNHQHLIDKEIKEMHTQSQYSSPEVLQERSHLTLQALKAIDLYACGIILWELMTRCRLPRLLDAASEEEHQAREQPEEYREPFERELGKDAPHEMLAYAVCKIKTRPRLKSCWLIGKKTVRFVGCMKNLWDQDFDARIHTATAIDRLEKLSLSERDLRYKYPFQPSREFDVATMWPPELKGTQAPPFPDKCGPNLVVEELSDYQADQVPTSGGREPMDADKLGGHNADEDDDDVDDNHFFQLLPKISHDSLRPSSAPVPSQQAYRERDPSSPKPAATLPPQAKSASPSFGRFSSSLRSRLSRSFLFRTGTGTSLQQQQRQLAQRNLDLAIEAHESMSLADRELSGEQDGFEVIELEGDKSFATTGQAYLAPAGSSTPK